MKPCWSPQICGRPCVNLQFWSSSNLWAGPALRTTRSGARLIAGVGTLGVLKTPAGPPRTAQGDSVTKRMETPSLNRASETLNVDSYMKDDKTSPLRPPHVDILSIPKRRCLICQSFPSSQLGQRRVRQAEVSPKTPAMIPKIEPLLASYTPS